MSAAQPLAFVARRARAPRALAEVLGAPWRIVGFIGSSAVVAFFYTLLLPFDYTQRFELANWGYLNAYLLAWAVVLGIAMGLVLSVQVYAMRKVVAARAASGAAGGVAFVASLLPSFLCCTPIVPSVLAFVGVSGVSLYTTTGALQHFFAVHQSEFLSASLALLVVMCWWGLRKVAGAACLCEDGCTLEGRSAPEAATRPKDFGGTEEAIGAGGAGGHTPRRDGQLAAHLAEARAHLAEASAQGGAIV
jgi:hypothetical protein